MNSFTVMFLIDRDGMGIRCRHGIINALFVATINALSIGQTNLGPSDGGTSAAVNVWRAFPNGA